MNLIFNIVVLIACFRGSLQHAYLIDPPARSSAWLVDEQFFECCQEFNHNQMFCGGKVHQFDVNDGKCSICGEAWDEPRKFDKGGEKYLGAIVKEYKTGSAIDVTVVITANHLGHFEFRVCKVDGWEGDATQECLDKTVLYLANTTSTEYEIKEDYSTVNLKIQLPEDLKCEHCVFQWKYVCGNSWGTDKHGNTVYQCTGCGDIQEHFFGCADIAIKDNIVVTTRKPTTKKITTYAPVYNKNSCERKLEFGTFMNFNNIVEIFCGEICENDCPKLMKIVDENMENKIPSEPDSLITCIDTCPKLCKC